MSDLGNYNNHSVFSSDGLKKQEYHKDHLSRDVMLGGSDLWTDGLICAFEFVPSRKKNTTVQSTSGLKVNHLFGEMPKKRVSTYNPTDYSPTIDSEVTAKALLDSDSHSPSGREEGLSRSYWVPIGWDRISELVQSVQVDAGWEPIDYFQDEEDMMLLWRIWQLLTGKGLWDQLGGVMWLQVTHL